MPGPRRWPPYPIPDDWSAEQAYAVANFCERLNYAIWGAYGSAIMDFLDASPEPPPSSRPQPHPLPGDWTPEQALRVADFCDHLNAEVWRAYRDAIGGLPDALAGHDRYPEWPQQLELPLGPERFAHGIGAAVVDDDDLPW